MAVRRYVTERLRLELRWSLRHRRIKAYNLNFIGKGTPVTRPKLLPFSEQQLVAIYLTRCPPLVEFHLSACRLDAPASLNCLNSDGVYPGMVFALRVDQMGSTNRTTSSSTSLNGKQRRQDAQRSEEEEEVGIAVKVKEEKRLPNLPVKANGKVAHSVTP